MDGRPRDITGDRRGRRRSRNRALPSQVSTDPSFTVSNTLDTTTDATALVPEVRLDDSTYYWRVRAKDGGSLNGPWSASGSFCTPQATQTRPGRLLRLGFPAAHLVGTGGCQRLSAGDHSGGQLTGDPITAAGTTTAAHMRGMHLWWVWSEVRTRGGCGSKMRMAWRATGVIPDLQRWHRPSFSESAPQPAMMSR